MNSNIFVFSALIWAVVFVGYLECQYSPNSTSSDSSTSNSEAPVTTDPNDCSQGSADCEACMDIGVKCLWCPTATPKCLDYPVGQLIPHSDVCALSDARWGTCSMNYEALLISMGVLGSILFLAIFACCCYCCCLKGWLAKRKAKKYRKEEQREEREKDARRVKHDERRAERKVRMDEIRKKYGLVKDDNPYQRFDA